MPDKTIKNNTLFLIVFRRLNLPKAREVAKRNSAITKDLTVVANVESTSLSPILPNIATKPANIADKRE